MLRVTKLADYGIVMLTRFATSPQSTFTARGIAQAAGLPLPAASKILKLLSKAGILASRRGSKGGYGLARRPEHITVAAIIHALDGPIALTQCSDAASNCGLQRGCPIQSHWHVINEAIRSTLEKVTLAQMMHPLCSSLAELNIPGSRASLSEALDIK